MRIRVGSNVKAKSYTAEQTALCIQDTGAIAQQVLRADHNKLHASTISAINKPSAFLPRGAISREALVLTGRPNGGASGVDPGAKDASLALLLPIRKLPSHLVEEELRRNVKARP